MTKREYDSLCDRETQLICGDDLKNQDDRTLLWGYTTSRASWHVYLAAGVIHTVMYDYGKEPEERPVASNADYVPNKRVYPEASDFEFCRLLIDRGVCIPYRNRQERHRSYPGRSVGYAPDKRCKLTTGVTHIVRYG